MGINEISIESFEDEVAKIPNMLGCISPALCIDFDKINFACDQILNSRSNTIDQIKFLNKIALSMVQILENSKDNRNQRKAFECFRGIFLRFISLEHFDDMAKLAFRLIDKSQFKAYRRNACVAFTNTIKKLSDKNRLNEIVKKLICISRKEDENGIQLDICDCLSKTSKYVTDKKTIMDIYGYFVEGVNSSDKSDRFIVALNIMVESLCEEKALYEAAVKYRINSQKERIRMLAYLAIKGTGAYDILDECVVSALKTI